MICAPYKAAGSCFSRWSIFVLIIFIILCRISAPACSENRSDSGTNAAQKPGGSFQCAAEASDNELIENEIIDLNRAVRLTLEKNLALRNCREKINQSRAQLDLARSAKGFKSRIEGGTMFQGPAVNLHLMGLGVILQTDYNTVGRLVVEKVLTTFGKVENHIAAAVSQIKAEEDNYEAQKNAVILETKKTYFAILRARAAYNVADEYCRLSGEYGELARKLHDKGVVSKFDVLRAETGIEEASRNRITIKKYGSLSSSTLLLLMDIRRDIPFDVKEEPARLPDDGDDVEKLQQMSLVNRYEIKSMKNNLDAAHALLRSARSLRNPDLVISGGYSYQTMQITFMPQYDWDIGLGIRIPLTDGGESDAKVKEARSVEKQLNTAKEGLEQQIRLEVKKAWLDMKEAESIVKVSLKEVEQCREGYRLAKARYSAGISISVEMDAALVSYHKARQSLVDSLYNLNVAVAALEKAVGAELPLHPMEMPDCETIQCEKGE
ncbi:MAG: TolC family protein [Candidatus Xenobiia bacterium LiM19]